jgi:glycerol-3-phosphate dehydrogenase
MVVQIAERKISTAPQRSMTVSDAEAKREMHRDPKRLASGTFDVLVVGAGIYGAWTAFDAAQRGLSVALIDQDDFGNATSANSQRIIHGGLRYLQHADLKRMRESIRERANLFRMAPHLSLPQPFLVPTYPGITPQNKLAMRVALKLNDLISWDRNRGVTSSKRLPPSRIIPRKECLALAPGLDARINGGAVFYDGQIVNSERLNFAVVRSAVQCGAVACNHLKAVRFVRQKQLIEGVEAVDTLNGQSISIRARMTIVCVGPWTGSTITSVLSGAERQSGRRRFDVFRAVVLVTRNFLHGHAVAIKGRTRYQDGHEVFGKGYRNFFVTPWRDTALVGTFYKPYWGDPDAMCISEDEIREYIDEFNYAYTDAKLTYDDVYWANIGLLPQAESCPGEDLQYEKHYTIIDHGQPEGIKGLITVVGVKWTTARDVAEKAVKAAISYLKPAVSRQMSTAQSTLYGRGHSDFDRFVEQTKQNRPPWLDLATLEHLIESHGDACYQIVELASNDPSLREIVCARSHTIAAEIVHAVRDEMAVTLCDVVLRRTPIGTLGWPGENVVRRVASILASELNWDHRRTEDEIAHFHREYARRGVRHQG